MSRLHDMLPASAGNTAHGRTGADNQTVRTLTATSRCYEERTVPARPTLWR